jgi:acyl dehydratase
MRMATELETLDELASFVGKELGISSWVDIDQARINSFAHATEDHQWIHEHYSKPRVGARLGGRNVTS